MKKQYLVKISLILILCLGISKINAQVSAYTFAQGVGTFTALTATYTTHTSGTTDEGVYAAVPIGFTFVYNCNSYTTVSINNNGYIGFGSTATYSYPSS
jgi:trimeric autotransporter adhesin